jgi:hypothetical protein
MGERHVWQHWAECCRVLCCGGSTAALPDSSTVGSDAVDANTTTAAAASVTALAATAITSVAIIVANAAADAALHTAAG